MGRIEAVAALAEGAAPGRHAALARGVQHRIGSNIAGEGEDRGLFRRAAEAARHGSEEVVLAIDNELRLGHE